MEIIALFCCVCVFVIQLPGNFGHLVAKPYQYETKYIDVPISHFDFTTNGTFKLRYLVNETHWSRRNGPIFFYCGNEGTIDVFAQNTGFMWEAAPEFKAMVVFAEHRYYGESMPFGNKSLSEPKYSGYLSSSEALADFVDVLYKIWLDKFPDSKPEKVAPIPVIAFGGSYGGMLAAWFRMKYPGVVIGALASSAPIFQFHGLTPCNVFSKITTSVYKAVHPECSESIRRFWAVVNNVTKSEDGMRLVSKMWNLCVDLKNPENVEALKLYVVEAIQEIAMMNYPYPTDFMSYLPGHPVQVFCEPLNNSRVPDTELLERVFKSISVYFNSSGTAKCLSYISSDTSSIGYDGWNLQACTEMVMPFCNDGVNDMFEKDDWNFQSFSDECYKTNKVRPQLRLVEKLYGGKRIQDSSNIIFSNGLLDPWSGGGVITDFSPSLAVFILPESAHHLDLRSSNIADPSSVKEARQSYKKIFRKWLNKYRKED